MSDQISEKVIFEQIGKVVRITLDNGKYNLFDKEQVIAFRDALLKVKDAPKVRSLLIQGKNQAFSAGFNLKEMSKDKTVIETYRAVGQEFIRILYNLPIPTICLVHKYAIGIGCLVPFASDFRFVLKDVEFCLPEIDYSWMFPTHGGMTITSKICRSATDAKYILMTGEHIGWELADKFGLVTKTFESKEEMDEKGLEFVTILSKKNYATMSMIKACFETCQDSPLEEGMMIENEATEINVSSSAEKKDMIKKFIEKYQK